MRLLYWLFVTIWLNTEYIPPYSLVVIAEHISTRQWIADCGPRIGSCMYVCPSRFWNAIKVPRMRGDNSVCITVFCVCVSACMHCSLHTCIYYNTSRVWWYTLTLWILDFAENFHYLPAMMISDSVLSQRTRQCMILHLDTIRNGIAHEVLAKSNSLNV